MAVGKAGLLKVDIRPSAQGYRTFAKLLGRNELWERARTALAQVRREKNLAVDWLLIGQKAIKADGGHARRWKLVWNEDESPIVLRLK